MNCRVTTFRRISQAVSLLTLLGLALSGQLRLDFEAQRIVLFGSYLWPHEIARILLLAATPLVILAGFSLFLGRAFCGWLCPQTLLCEMATWLQRRAASVQRQGSLPYGLTVVAATILAAGMAFTGAAVILSPLLPPQSIQNLAAGALNTSVLKGITVVTLILLVDVGLFRHTFCEWLCVLGWWQRLFARKAALRVRFDLDRAKECTRCTDCKAACFMGIEPRRRFLPGTCLNCGECVKACDRQRALATSESLIRYAFGTETRKQGQTVHPSLWRADMRLAGYCLLLTVFAGLLGWSIWSRSPVQVRVRQVALHPATVAGNQVEGVFVIDVYNASDSPGVVHLDQTGLPPGSAAIMPNPVSVPPGGRAEATLQFTLDRGVLQPGRNSFSVTANGAQGGASGPSQRVTFGLPAFLP